MRHALLLALLLAVAAPALADEITGSLYLPRPTFVTGTYYVERDDCALLVDCSGGNVTIWLPQASSSVGRVLSFLSVGAHGAYTITVRPRAGQTINGSTAADSTSLSAQWDRAEFLSDGVQWFALTKYRTGTVSATTIYVTNLKAADATPCATIADSSGKMHVTTAFRAKSGGFGEAAPDTDGDLEVLDEITSDDVHTDNLTNEAGTGAPSATHGLTAAANKDISVSGTGAFKGGRIEAADGTEVMTSANSTAKTLWTSGAQYPSLGVGVAPDDTAGNAKVNNGLGVGSAQAAGGDGVAKVKTSLDTAAIKALDGTGSVIITNSTGDFRVTTTFRGESAGVGVAADGTPGNLIINNGLGVGAGQAAGADGVAKVKTAVDAPALRSLDGTQAATIADTTGNVDFAAAISSVGPCTAQRLVASGVRTVSTTWTIGTTEAILLIDASANDILITLPDATSHIGRLLEMKLITAPAGNTITVTAAAGQSIDGSPSTTTLLDAQWEHAGIIGASATTWVTK